MTVPEMVQLIAIALVAVAPPLQTFQRRHDFAARLRLMPRQHLTGGGQPPGATTKMGERLPQRLLIIGPTASSLREAFTTDATRHLAWWPALAQAIDAGQGRARQHDGTSWPGADDQDELHQASTVAG